MFTVLKTCRSLLNDRLSVVVWQCIFLLLDKDILWVVSLLLPLKPHSFPFLTVASGIELSCSCYKMHIQGSGPFYFSSVSNNVQLLMSVFLLLLLMFCKNGQMPKSDFFFFCMLTSSRHLSEEGIAELKGSAEKITASDAIRIALNVSCSSDLSFPQQQQWHPCQLSGSKFFTDVCGY